MMLNYSSIHSETSKSSQKVFSLQTYIAQFWGSLRCRFLPDYLNKALSELFPEEQLESVEFLERHFYSLVADIFERRIESFIREFKSTHEDRWNSFVTENVELAKSDERSVYKPKELQEQHIKLAT